MTFAFAFWVLMLIWVVFRGWSSWGQAPTWGPWGGDLLLLVLLGLLGWQVFGAPIHH